jgi:hypothetical protein
MSYFTLTEPLALLDNFIKGLHIVIEHVPRYLEFSQVFKEYIDINICQYIIDNHIVDESQENLLKKLITKVKFDQSGSHYVNVIHEQSIKHGNSQYGRFYPKNSIIPLSRKIKHTVFKYLGYVDLDMVSGHISIMVSICKNNGKPHASVERYLREKNKIIAELKTFYSDKLTASDIKFLFNIIIYGGTFDVWTHNMKSGNKHVGYDEIVIGESIIFNTDIIHPFILSFEAECVQFRDDCITNNKELYDEVIHKCDFILGSKGDRSFMSYFYQIIENHILFLTYRFLVNNKFIKANEVCLEYDGLCIPHLKKDHRFITEDALIALNKYIYNHTKLELVKMDIKSYSDALDDVIAKSQSLIDDQSYSVVKEKFEYGYKNNTVEHFKIISLPVFVRAYKKDIITEKQSLSYYNESDLVSAYKHIKYIDENGIKKCFIKDWVIDEFLRTYDDIDVYPNIDECPNDTYNTWHIFDMEKKLSFIENIQGREILRAHIRDIICNRNIPLFNYFESWIASLIQNPTIKMKCPVIIGKQGAGKSTLIVLLRKILGNRCVFECTKPSRDVYGMFNGGMMSAYLVVLSEIKDKDTKDYDSELKGLITESHMLINRKGRDQESINSYHKFIICTNHMDPMTLTIRDRRYFYLRCSDEKCEETEANGDYHSSIYNLIDNIDCCKTFYDYYKKYIIPTNFYKVKPPTTEDDSMCMDANMDAITLFLKQTLFNQTIFTEGKLLIITNAKLYDNYEKFRIDNNIVEVMNKIKFGKEINQNEAYGKYMLTYGNGGGSRVINLYMLADEYKVNVFKSMTFDYFIKKYNNWKSKDNFKSCDEYINYIENYDNKQG